MSLAEALERAASALPAAADAIRPANGDPDRLLEGLAPAQAERVLGWMLEHEAGDGLELALAWAETERGADVLGALDENALGKEPRKLLRRARHAAKSRGLELRDRPTEGRVASLPRLADELSGAFVSPLDPSGARLVVIVEPAPSGGARVFEIALDEARGILHFDAFTTSRSDARRFQRSITRRERFAALRVPVEAARALVARAATRQPAARPAPSGFLEWRARLGEAGPDAVTPGELVWRTLGARARPELCERAGALIRSGEVGPWPPEEEILRPEAERLQEAGRSPIVVSEAQRGERLKALLDEAVTRVFDARFAACTAERFAEAAYVLWKSEREDAALACLAASEAFRNGGPERDALAQTMLEHVLTPILEQLAHQEKESLVARPGAPPPGPGGAPKAGE